MEAEGIEIERGTTGVRCLLTLLFLIIARVVGTVILIIVLFELAYTLITMSPPPERLRAFANRAVAYVYRIMRYVTYSEARAPFPFVDFPDELEPLAAPHTADE